MATLFVAAVMLRSAWGLLRDSGRVLLEAAPEGMSVEEIGRAIAAHPTSRTCTFPGRSTFKGIKVLLSNGA